MRKYIISFISILSIGIVLLFFGVYFRLEKSLTSENVFPVMKAIIKLHFGGNEMVQVIPFKSDIHTTSFVARTRAGNDPIIQYMKEQGWFLKGQFGSALSFKKNDELATVVYQGIITKYYRIIEIPPLE